VRRRYLVAALVLGVVLAAGVLLAVALDEKPEPVADTDAVDVSTLPTVPAALELTPPRCSELAYEGEGAPDVAVVFEAPVLASSGDLEQEWRALPARVLEARGWRAAGLRVGMFACDNTTFPGMSRDPNPPSCAANAEAYSAEPAVVAVAQAGGDACSALALIVSDGWLGRISASGTYDCLTQGGEGCEEAEPEKYQSGGRSFVHLRANGRVQAASLAGLARAEGLRRVYVLDDAEAYGVALAAHFVQAAGAAGIEVTGAGSWDGKADAYRQLMRRIDATDPDAILLAGLVDENGGQVIRDKVAVLGPNDGRVRLLASDGFVGPATLDEAGAAADGMLVASAGLPLSELPEQGRELVAALESEASGTLQPDDALRLVYAAAALEVALDAIARSDGTRAGVLDAIFATRIEDGYTGPVGFDLYGDPTSRPIRIEHADAGQWLPYRTIEPDDALVQAASG
jgi:branched-chain amino acid transport system substrate-binding protein